MGPDIWNDTTNQWETCGMLLGQINQHDFSPIRSWQVALIYWQTFRENHISLDDPWIGGQLMVPENYNPRLVQKGRPDQCQKAVWESRPSKARPFVKHVGWASWKSHPRQVMHIQYYTILVWILHPRFGVKVRDRCEPLPTMVRENKAK